ncbi:polysaccharide biosynthesis tyrosine autokinase [Vibrio tubiashii]|uniref:non-specific protein-tyrosine kinase n=1 Tax=Vibrio tubiashii ATCC 19109 TaxID=1051646 RepID=F9TC64_9VIBR|nr:polysaccharide biosynthesis tyrosine autokinase [Vibrio tubiashii]AIW16164.1 ATPase [Vibrio tubiashii ATCC 19109]EGU48117.1 putative exopolysaccharide biosynthesis protein [Vibrio tubiashii ATCC 19109]EIF03499.1 capsular polysaccharide synthesis enzyme CpsD exopolysaccharide synthesis [Vibrio tubiashii NCIMB 1337 = ATCC 19106]
MHSQSETVPQSQLLDLGYYIHLIKTRWLPIVTFAVLCSAIAILVVLSITPVYKATATLLIDSSTKKAVSIEEVVGFDTSTKEYYQTQLEILKSNQVAQRVIDKLELAHFEEFNSALKHSEPGIVSQLKLALKSLPVLKAYMSETAKEPTAEEVEEQINRKVLKAFKAKLSISPVRKTQLVRISFESEDPQLAAQIANEVGHAFIENNLESKLLATEQATSWINTRLSELKNKLDESETKLLAFLKKQELIDDSGIVALTSSELSNLTDRIAKATEKRIETQAVYSALRNSNSKDVTTLASIPLISNHPQIRDIRQAESEAVKRVSELSKRYGPKHDKMIQAQAQLETISHRANRVVAKLVNGIEKELTSAVNQERLLRDELLAKKDEFQELSLVKREYDVLKRDVDTNAKLYDLFLTRQKEASATSDFSSSNARFSDYALVPEAPSKPNRKLIVVLAFAISLGFALVVVIAQDAFNNTIESSRDFENKLGLLPTGTIPKIKDKMYKKSPLDSSVFANDKFTVFQESVDSIRTSLVLSLHNTQRKLIAVSSSVPGEGKTTTSVNLALSFSKLERVLLVDCDLRKPSIAQRFKLNPSTPGLVNHLLMNNPLEECITSIEGTNLDVMSAGMVAPDPQELLGSQGFTELIEKLETKYDRIIIDTPPILPVKDSFIVGKMTGGIILVLKANSTTKSVYKHTMTLFTKHKIVIDGVVLNQVPAAKKGKHTYSEYATYAYGQS